MFKHFASEQYEIVRANEVRIADYQFGHNKQGELDVWIDSGNTGERFLSRIIIEGETYPVRTEVYTKKCYILREKATGRYWFLDKNDSGFWLHNETFSGAATFYGAESIRIQEWLAQSVA